MYTTKFWLPIFRITFQTRTAERIFFYMFYFKLQWAAFIIDNWQLLQINMTMFLLVKLWTGVFCWLGTRQHRESVLLYRVCHVASTVAWNTRLSRICCCRGCSDSSYFFCHTCLHLTSSKGFEQCSAKAEYNNSRAWIILNWKYELSCRPP